MKIDLDIPHTFVEGRRAKSRYASSQLEKVSRQGNNLLNWLLAAAMLVLLAYGIGFETARHIRVVEQQQEQAEANRHAMISNAIYLQQQVDCAKVIVREEAANQPFRGMVAVVWTLKNRAALYGTSICAEATRLHGVRTSANFDYSALNVLFDATRKAIAVRENTKARNKTELAAMKNSESASAAVITGGYPDITHGATYYISEPAGAKDPRFHGFKDFKANFVRRNRLDATPTAIIGAHWFFKKPHAFTKRAQSSARVPIPLARPYSTRERKEQFTAQTSSVAGVSLDFVYTVTNAAFGTSFGTKRMQVAESVQ